MRDVSPKLAKYKSKLNKVYFDKDHYLECSNDEYNQITLLLKNRKKAAYLVREDKIFCLNLDNILYIERDNPNEKLIEKTERIKL